MSIYNTTHNTTHDTYNTDMPSLYNSEGKLDITARRNAIIARMKAFNVAQKIWDSRMGDDN